VLRPGTDLARPEDIDAMLARLPPDLEPVDLS